MRIKKESDMTPALKELEVSQGKRAGPTHRSCKAESDDVPPDDTWSTRTMEGGALECMSVTGMDQERPHDSRGVGTRLSRTGRWRSRREAKRAAGQRHQRGDLRREREMAWFGWSLMSIKHLDCRSLEGQAEKVGL